MTSYREYFFDVDLHGNVYHEGEKIDDTDFLDFFYKQMRENQTGKHSNYPYFSPCGLERNYIRCADVPIVFQRINDEYLEYAGTMKQTFLPDKLRFSDDGVLYHPASIGNYGRIASIAIMALSPDISVFGPLYALKIDGVSHVIEPIIPLDNVRVIRPRPENKCIACGAANSSGLQLSFLYNMQDNTAHSWITPDERTAGALGYMHGGFISLLLDEVMGKVLSGRNIKAPTAQLKVDFRKPIPLYEEIMLVGQLITEYSRKFSLRGKIINNNGTILAEAEALFIRTDNKSP